MTKKIFRIVLILFVLFYFCTSYVNATGINLNLPGTTTDNTQGNAVTNQEVQDNNTQAPTDNTVQNPTSNEQTNQVQNPDNTLTDDNTTYDITPPSSDGTDTLTPSGISSASESGLGVTNIINILLITVGVIIIALAIAILIRLKN